MPYHEAWSRRTAERQDQSSLAAKRGPATSLAWLLGPLGSPPGQFRSARVIHFSLQLWNLLALCTSGALLATPLKASDPESFPFPATHCKPLLCDSSKPRSGLNFTTPHSCTIRERRHRTSARLTLSCKTRDEKAATRGLLNASSQALQCSSIGPRGPYKRAGPPRVAQLSTHPPFFHFCSPRSKPSSLLFN